MACCLGVDLAWGDGPGRVNETGVAALTDTGGRAGVRRGPGCATT